MVEMPMNYRELLDLTDEEIIFIIKDIFPYTSRVDNIKKIEKAILFLVTFILWKNILTMQICWI